MRWFSVSGDHSGTCSLHVRTQACLPVRPVPPQAILRRTGRQTFLPVGQGESQSAVQKLDAITPLEAPENQLFWTRLLLKRTEQFGSIAKLCSSIAMLCYVVSSEICVLDSVWIIFDLFKLMSLFCRAANCLSFVGMVLKLMTSTSPSLFFVFKHHCQNWCWNQIVLSLEACCFPVSSRTGPYRKIYICLRSF